MWQRFTKVHYPPCLWHYTLPVAPVAQSVYQHTRVLVCLCLVHTYTLNLSVLSVGPRTSLSKAGSFGHQLCGLWWHSMFCWFPERWWGKEFFFIFIFQSLFSFSFNHPFILILVDICWFFFFYWIKSEYIVSLFWWKKIFYLPSEGTMRKGNCQDVEE